MGAEYAVWEHSVTGEKVVRTMEYSLPELVHAHGERPSAPPPPLYLIASDVEPAGSAPCHTYDYVW